MLNREDLKLLINECAATTANNALAKIDPGSSLEDIFPKKLEIHLSSIMNWSQGTQIYGLGAPKITDSETIKLSYHGTARKFRGHTSTDSTFAEDALLSGSSNFILTGDPGAGKTTSLKRIVRIVMRNFEHENVRVKKFPILIRLKELEHYSSIHQCVANALGFETNIRERIVIEESKELDHDENNKPYMKTVKKEKRIPFEAIGSTELKIFVEKFLEASVSILFIDGLDEIDQEYLSAFLSDIRKLALDLFQCKIIITCRTGFYYDIGALENFNVLDILPLDDDQLFALASIWLKKPDIFIKALKGLPYKDLANRPLLLSQLLFIFDRYGTLPSYPKEIYRQIVDLLIREWDGDRRIVRSSRYSDFSPNRKADFLSELAFYLMYTNTNKNKQFGTRELVNAYDYMHSKFELPHDEGVEVAKEIETHTGIIVSVGHSSFEFSHLSIQEYLCAEYIVKSPLSHKTVDLITSYAEPVAVAIALASDATEWICNLITDQDCFTALNPFLGSFVSRLIIERPVFRKSDLLGFCVFQMYSEMSRGKIKNLTPIFKKLHELPGIMASIELFLTKSTQTEIKFIGGGNNKQIQVAFSLPRHHMAHAAYKRTVCTSIPVFKDFLKCIKFPEEKTILGLDL